MLNNTTHYIVVSEPTVQELNQKVTKYLKTGFELKDSLQITVIDNKPLYTQVLVGKSY